MTNGVGTDRLRPEALDLPPSGIVDVMSRGRLKDGLIPLYVGEGDQPTPDFIMAAAERALRAGETFYTWQRGIPELRAAIARYQGRVYGGEHDPERMFVSVGGMHAALMAIRMFAGEGDELLIPSPCWPNFDAAARLYGAVPVAVPIDCTPTGWKLDLDRLAAAVTPRTRAMLVNTPANPTGWVATPDDLRGILAIARKHGLWIVADEIYTRFVHDPAVTIGGDRPGTIARSPSFRDVMEPEDRVVFVQTFSKNWAMTGWRVGWLEAPARLGPTIENLVQYTTSGVTSFIQKAAVTALDDGEDFVASQIARARRNRQVVCEGLRATNVVDLPAPSGAFYAFFRVQGVADTKKLALDLIDRAGVGLAPGTAFGPGGHTHLRLCYLRREADIDEAVARLAETLPKLAATA